MNFGMISNPVIDLAAVDLVAAATLVFSAIGAIAGMWAAFSAHRQARAVKRQSDFPTPVAIADWTKPAWDGWHQMSVQVRNDATVPMDISWVRIDSPRRMKLGKHRRGANDPPPKGPPTPVRKHSADLTLGRNGYGTIPLFVFNGKAGAKVKITLGYSFQSQKNRRREITITT